MLTIRRLGYLTFVLGCTLGAQSAGPRTIAVVDAGGISIPHAVVQIGGATPLVANAEGRVPLAAQVKLGAALDLWVRRVGYRAFRESVRLGADDSVLVVVLTPLAASLAAVNVTADRSTPLTRTGFYGRIERVRRGAFTAEFVTPEELESRHPSRTTDMLRGRRSIRVVQAGGGANAVLGRSDCAMTILVDGQRLRGTVQDQVGYRSATAIPGTPRASPPAPNAGRATSIDDLVGANEIMAIEIYPSLANAPDELIPLTGGGDCGLIAIWTGGRS